MLSIQELQRISTQVRRDIIRMTNRAASGHPGGSLGAADLLTALYFGVMDHDPERFTIDGKEQDLFFLSNGHISPAWYSVLARSGYFEVSELSTFRFINSRLQGHPSVLEGLPGIRMSSGSLGQGLSTAIGAALTKRMNGERKLVYCLTGDGELQEGQNWEAFLFAAAKKVDNLIAIIDHNGKQIDGDVENVVSLGNLKAKLEAFDWHVVEMFGNDMHEVVNGLALAREHAFDGKPVVIIMRTHMGSGVDFMLDNHEWHGVAPNDEQARRALEQLEETLGDF
jgi:transketolase